MPELPLVGDEFAGYRLRAVLGRGGMSTVYQAENPRLGNVIALKVLAPELATDDVFRTRFLEESRIAAAMNHPHVIPIHDMGSTDGLLYIAMRCVSGTDLRQMIAKRGRLLPDTSIFLLSQAARALDAAHRRGLVHRDVKPGNLLAERGNDDSDPDHLYLADFGITKPAIGRTGLTATGAFLGTIDYIAPEQIRGLSVLGMADQYSLGCVLYECLAGRVPFEKDLDAAIIWAHVEEPPTRLTLLRPDLPPAIDEVFDRVLAKQPGDRYENCREFMGAARQALGLPDAPAGTPPGGFSRRVLRPAPPAPDYQEVAHDPHDAHDVRTGLRVMSASVAPPASLPRENLPSLPELTPVPEWSTPYLPSGLPGGVARLDGPAG
ncbi:MAG TPA: serine/threonine-protein kinase, partial [Trebonia sp.]|nr:serine/threonine-protein kinase [Trebonia sp.]